MIIGISGKMGVGKDYLVEHFLIPYFKEQGKRVFTICFADQIKINAATQNNISILEMFGNKTPEMRKMLQITGTEEGRDKYGADVWINYVANWIKLWRMRDLADVFIITDCRFKNEVAWIESQLNSKVIRITAPDRNMERLNKESKGDPELLKSISTHQSETDLDEHRFKHVINNQRGINAETTMGLLKSILR